MSFRIEYTDKIGNTGYLDQYSRLSSSPFHWKSEKSARNILRNLKKQAGWEYVIKDDDVTAVSEKTFSSKTPEKAEETSREMTEVEELQHAMEVISSYAASIDSAITTNSSILSEEDRKMEDMLHCLELSKLNAAGIAKLAKMMKASRKRRRKSKDMIFLLKTIKSISPENAKAMLDAVNTLSNREYKPRELTDIF